MFWLSPTTPHLSNGANDYSGGTGQKPSQGQEKRYLPSPSLSPPPSWKEGVEGVGSFHYSPLRLLRLAWGNLLQIFVDRCFISSPPPDMLPLHFMSVHVEAQLPSKLPHSIVATGTCPAIQNSSPPVQSCLLQCQSPWVNCGKARRDISHSPPPLLVVCRSGPVRAMYPA